MPPRLERYTKWLIETQKQHKKAVDKAKSESLSVAVA